MKIDVNIILALIAGLATAIPMAIMLGRYIKKAVKEKNWPAILKLLLDLMAQAEVNLADGADRKKWVMSEMATAAKTIGYDIDMDAISALIDNLCDMAKVVNA